MAKSLYRAENLELALLLRQLREDAGMVQTTLAERYGLNLRDYAAFGGSVPLYLTSGCQIGSVTVSGAPQRDDHNLVLGTLREMLGIAPAELTLVADVV